MNIWGEIIDMPEHVLKCFILQQVSQAARAGAEVQEEMEAQLKQRAAKNS